MKYYIAHYKCIRKQLYFQLCYNNKNLSTCTKNNSAVGKMHMSIGVGNITSRKTWLLAED